MQASHLIINGVGVAAAACSMASFVPQAVKIIRERDASSVSLRMYVVTVTGFALWTSYGVLLHSWPLVGSNLVCLALAGFILALKLRLRKTSANESRPPPTEKRRRP